VPVHPCSFCAPSFAIVQAVGQLEEERKKFKELERKLEGVMSGKDKQTEPKKR